MTVLATDSINQIADELARALVRTTSRDDMARLSLPLLYPGGSMVGVELSRLRGGFRVSDSGSARREAELLGGERSFQRIAPDIAQRFGIRFDHHMMFALDVAHGDLLSAVVAVANAAKAAVENTAIEMATTEHADHRAFLWDKLQIAFGSDAFHRETAKFKGSTEQWDFDAGVRAGSNVVLFEIVTPHASSVNSAVTKFLDVRDLGDQIAPRRVAVLTNRARTPRLALLGRTARTLDADAPAQDYRKAA
jgi:hypothetical protein